MNRIGFVSTAVLSLTLGVSASAYAQADQHSDKQDRPQQQGKQEQARHEESRPAQEHAQRPQHRQEQVQQEEHARHSERNDRPHQDVQQHRDQNQQHAQQQRQNQNVQRERAQPQERTSRQAQVQQRHERTPQQQRVRQSAWQQHRSQHWDSDHRTWQQRGGYRGYRIPEDRYRGYFGRDHGFRISGLPFLVVGGYPRFQYSGYWFSPVDPWPEYWASDWYDTDDVYVMYIDNGYYMYNRRYPTTGIAIRISL